MAELMKGQGNLVILQGGLGASNLNERTAGFKKAIAGTKIKLLEVTDVAGDFSVATNKTEALLQTYPDLTAIFAVSAEGAPAAAQVLKQQGKAGKILLAGFDDLKDTLEGIRDGSVSFCLVQKTFKMGWLSVEALLDAGKGKKLPPVTDTGVLFVTKANVGGYMDEMKKEFAEVARAVPRRARGVAVRPAATPPLRGERHGRHPNGAREPAPLDAPQEQGVGDLHRPGHHHDRDRGVRAALPLREQPLPGLAPDLVRVHRGAGRAVRDPHRRHRPLGRLGDGAGRHGGRLRHERPGSPRRWRCCSACWSAR